MPNTADAQQILDLLLAHRSVRRFRPDAVPDEDVRRAVEAGQMASTSSNVQGYCLIRVQDPIARERLAEIAGPQRKVVDSGAFFVVCGDTHRHRLIHERAGTPYRGRLEAFLVSVIDASLFAQNLCVAFEAMGYGICYVGGIRNDLREVDRTLRLPEGVYPLFGLCVGVPAEDPIPRPRLPLPAVLFDDRYPDAESLLAEIERYDAEHARYLEARGSKPRPWTELMAGKYAEAQRVDVGPYYRSKGADLS